MRALLLPPHYVLRVCFRLRIDVVFQPRTYSAVCEVLQPHFGFFKLFAQPQWWEDSVQFVFPIH